MDALATIKLWKKQGWLPVKWAHHPRPIKAALRTIGLRPALKQCWRNTQHFLLANRNLDLGLDLEYCEGWVAGPVHIPFEHAWLRYRGDVLDLTIPERAREYETIAELHYPVEVVARSLLASGSFGPVNPYRLEDASPWAERSEQLRALASQGVLP